MRVQHRVVYIKNQITSLVAKNTVRGQGKSLEKAVVQFYNQETSIRTLCFCKPKSQRVYN